jgi:outer membrane protein assembly factor BamA
VVICIELKKEHYRIFALMRILLLLLLLLPSLVKAQDTLEHRKLKVLPVPAFGYSPETRYYIGAVSLFTMDFYQDGTRTSNAKVEFNYTQNRQLILDSEVNYFFKQEKWFLNGVFHFSKYPDRYYGIGAQTLDVDEVIYQSNRFKLDLELSRQIRPKLFVGGGFRYFNYSNFSILSETTSVPDELRSGDNIEFKLDAFKDSRNRLLTPTQGVYYKATIGFNTSESPYVHALFDARKYLSLGQQQRQVLAFRFLQTSVIGNAPFYELAILGGDRIARGYFYGRFRDKHLTTGQLEYRSPYWWRLGAAVFGGTSAVYGSGTFTEWNIKPNAGIGLRFLVDKNDRTNLRFDYAVGRNGQNGFYISFGESF